MGTQERPIVLPGDFIHGMYRRVIHAKLKTQTAEGMGSNSEHATMRLPPPITNDKEKAYRTICISLQTRQAEAGSSLNIDELEARNAYKNLVLWAAQEKLQYEFQTFEDLSESERQLGVTGASELLSTAMQHKDYMEAVNSGASSKELEYISWMSSAPDRLEEIFAA